MLFRRFRLAITFVFVLLLALLMTRRSTLFSTLTKYLGSHANSTLPQSMAKTPVYFLSHGGPNLFEHTTHPAYSKLQSIGREITQQVRPQAVIVISAHWQAEPRAIEVNIAEDLPLVYDYYGFPEHYYELQYPNTGSAALGNRVLNLLKDAGIKAEGVKRGLDHGVFIPFLVAFDPKKNPLNCPIVQVSLFDSDSGQQHLKLGAALSSLRDEGVMIIASGMAVHNLRDFRNMRMGVKPSLPDGTMPYTNSFDEALREAVENENPGTGREDAMVKLLEGREARMAHPSFEHLLPVYVAAGAAADDLGKRLWTLGEGSMSWAQYRFGNV